MSFSTTTRQSLGILAAACLLSVALPAGPAMAQKLKKDKGTTTETSAPAAPPEVNVVIPSIDAVGSNVDDATLLAIFSGNVTDNAEALAGLTATSISIPEITVSITGAMEGDPVSLTYTLNGLVMSDVANGVAGSLTIANPEFDMSEAGTSVSYGAFTANNLNIGGILSVLGLVEGDGSTEFQSMFTDVTVDGATMTYPNAECTLGPMSTGEMKMRPFAYSIPDMMTLIAALPQDDEAPSMETVASLLRMYADILTAVESAPVEYGGIDCSGSNEDGQAFDVKIAGMTMEGFGPGIYPAISLDGLDLTIPDEGSFSIGNATFKGMDLSGPIATLNTVPDDVDESWFDANARSFIPAIHGLSLSDIVIDVPDMENPGSRINASLGAFDLSLADYLNGIPTDIKLSASNIVLAVPADSEDEQYAQLAALGITSIDAGFGIDASWNAADNTIAINELSLSGVDLATIALSGTITNATEALFGIDEDAALAAAMDLAVSQLNLDITDAGLAAIIMSRVAADQGSDAATMRPVYAGLAQGMVIGQMAGAAEAQQVGSAISAFISGTAKHLNIGLTAKEAPGIGVLDLMAAENDPTSLIGKVTIDATAD